MLLRSIRVTVPAALLLAPRALAQLVGDPVYDYCQGDGSICQAASDLFEACSAENGDRYFECICTNGYIPTEDMCQWCRIAGNLGGYLSDNMSNMCEAENYDVAPVPSSIISQQEERNETTSMPEVTYTATYTYTYTTPDFEAWTVTIKGEEAGDVTLPTLPEVPTETGAATTLGGKATLSWQWVAGLVAAMTVVW